MGLGEMLGQTAQILLLAKADTSDVRDKLRDLKDQQKQVAAEAQKAGKAQSAHYDQVMAGIKKTTAAAEDHLKAIDSQNKSYERWAKGFQGLNVGIQLFTKGVQLGGAAWKDYEKHAMAAGGAEAERAKTFRKSLNEWNEGLERISVQFGRLIVEMEPVIGALGKIAKGVASVMAEVPNGLVGVLGGAGAGAAIGGKIAGKGGAAIGAGVGAGVGTGVAIGNAVADALPVNSLLAGAYAGIIKTETKLATARLDSMEAGSDLIMSLKDLGIELKLIQADALLAAKAEQAKRAVKGYRAEAKQEPIKIEVEDRTGYAPPPAQSFNDSVGMPPPSTLSLPEVANDPGASMQNTRDQLAEARASILELAAAFDEVENQRRETLLKSLFGDFEEWDGYAEKMQMLSEVAGVFGDQLQASFGQWVDGSASMKEAINQLYAGTIKGIAHTLMAHAVEHGALALGALASLNFAQAGLHSTAAAGFAAAAVTVGAYARTLGGSGAGASPGGAGAGRSGGSAPRLSGSGGGGDRQESINIYLGDTLAEDNPRAQRNRIARAVRSAHRELEQTRGVEYR